MARTVPTLTASLVATSAKIILVLDYNYLTAHIFTIADFLTAEECGRYIALAEGKGFDDAPINTLFGPVVEKEIRNNERVIVDDLALANAIWERAKDYVPGVLAGFRALGINERFRFYRYDPGQAFRWHRDGYFQRENGERSRLTLMVYLNDDFEGGETLFEEVVVRPQRGMALCFIHHLLHEGAEVISGRKYVLRTDVMYSG
jgi:predicted 2-oxoglutarate/Fe(II)-dependent dioxygenase YbiX